MKHLFIVLSIISILTSCRKEEVVTRVDGYPPDVVFFRYAKILNFELVYLSSLNNTLQEYNIMIKDAYGYYIYYNENHSLEEQDLPYSYDFYSNYLSISSLSKNILFKVQRNNITAGEVIFNLEDYKMATVPKHRDPSSYTLVQTIEYNDNQNGMVVRLTFELLQ